MKTILSEIRACRESNPQRARAFADALYRANIDGPRVDSDRPWTALPAQHSGWQLINVWGETVASFEEREDALYVERLVDHDDLTERLRASVARERRVTA
jgi:hypothetical protein